MRGTPLVRGFLCGSFLAGAIAVPYGLFIQAALLVVCLVIFVDSSCVFGREKHILSFLFLMSLGLVAGLLSALVGMISVYMLLVFVAMTIFYLLEYAKSRV